MQTLSRQAYRKHITRSINQGVRPLTFKQFMDIVWEICKMAMQGK